MATDTPTAPDKTATAAEPPKTERPKTNDSPAAATSAASSQADERTTAPPAEPKPASPPKRARAKAKPRPRRAAATKSTAATKRQTKAEPARPTSQRHTARPTSTSAPARNRNRAVALSVIDAQERSAHALVDYQMRAAELSRIPGAATLMTAQADLLRRATVTYVDAARGLLK
jgi:hypothetical protein